MARKGFLRGFQILPDGTTVELRGPMTPEEEMAFYRASEPRQVVFGPKKQEEER